MRGLGGHAKWFYRLTHTRTQPFIVKDGHHPTHPLPGLTDVHLAGVPAILQRGLLCHQVPSPHGPVHTRCRRQYPGTRGQHIGDGVRVRPDGDTATPEEDAHVPGPGPEGEEIPEAVQGRDGA